uniref:Uncharacterized protein n=1 Tax=Toxoplasma gondii TgCATBr9 TaxID=943120 RepID=A0A2T6J4S6_TOXGO|nr:hypothetical protein TGBR9_358740 [Toxoplasma gondii TgCATBr9]
MSRAAEIKTGRSKGVSLCQNLCSEPAEVEEAADCKRVVSQCLPTFMPIDDGFPFVSERQQESRMMQRHCEEGEAERPHRHAQMCSMLSGFQTKSRGSLRNLNLF